MDNHCPTGILQTSFQIAGKIGDRIPFHLILFGSLFIVSLEISERVSCPQLNYSNLKASAGSVFAAFKA
jgi:hypothetical protein